MFEKNLWLPSISCSSNLESTSLEPISCIINCTVSITIFLYCSFSSFYRFIFILGPQPKRLRWGCEYILDPDLQIINNSIQNLNRSNFFCNFNSSFNTLFIISSIQSHSMIPKCFEKWWQDIFLYINRVNAISSTTLLYH